MVVPEGARDAELPRHPAVAHEAALFAHPLRLLHVARPVVHRDPTAVAVGRHQHGTAVTHVGHVHLPLATSLLHEHHRGRAAAVPGAQQRQLAVHLLEPQLFLSKALAASHFASIYE